MSNYIATGATSGFFNWLWGGSGSSGTTASKTPGKSTDFQKLKMIWKQQLIDKLGPYPQAVLGQVYPLTDIKQAEQIALFWAQLGIETQADVPQQGKSSSSRWQEALPKVKDAYDCFQSAHGVWFNQALRANDYVVPKGGGAITVLQPTNAKALWDILSTYVVELDNAVWAGFNIETPSERALWAIKDSVPKVIRDVAGGALDILKFGFNLTKVAMVGALALGGYWLFTKVRKQ